MFAILLLLAIVLPILIFLLQTESERRRHDGVAKAFPGPRPLPLIGNALLFSQDSTKNFVKLVNQHRQYGRSWLLSFGPHDYSLMVADCQLAEFLLTSTRLIDKSRDYRFLHPWLGTGLLTSTGAKWKTRRRILTPAFHFKILEEFGETFCQNAQILVDLLAKEAMVGKPFNLYRYVTLCTLDNICDTTMGVSVNAQTNANSEYVQAVKDISRIVTMRTFSIWHQFETIFRLTKEYRLHQKCLKTLHSFTKGVIQQRKQEFEAGKNSRENKHENLVDEFGIRQKKVAFLDILLQNGTLSDEDIREEVDTFMFEGHDTISSGITFALYALSRQPEVQDKITEEINRVLGPKNSTISYAKMNEMKYLEMVIKECLRLYPPVPMFARRINQTMEYDGVRLEKGLEVGLMAFLMHRDPIYYPNPDKFDPERFSSDNQTERHPFAYIPFSAGSRNCIGQRFAMLELKVVLTSVLRRYRLLPADDNGNGCFEPELKAEAILKSANGVYIRLQKLQE